MGKGRVLIIEDDAALRKLVGMLLQGAGFEVESVGDGASGLESLATRSFDLILLDMVLPRMSGWTFLRRLAARSSPPPVIVCSARYYAPQPLGDLERYVWAYIRKPFQSSLLMQTCDRVYSAVKGEGLGRNRRGSMRHRVTSVATLLSEYGAPVAAGEAQDISLTGARIAMKRVVGVGQILSLRLDPAESVRPIHLKARVVWVRNDAIGVVFESVTAVQNEQISELLMQSDETSEAVQ